MATPKATSRRRKDDTGIRERSPGHYQLRVFNKATGKQESRTFVASRPDVGIREARTALAKLKAEVATGKFGGTNATLGFVIDEFIRHSETRGRSPGTLGGYRSNAGKIKAGPLADKSVTKVTAHDLDTYYVALQAEGMTPATVHHHHRLIRAALNQAVKWGWVPSNVALRATVSNGPAPEMHVPTLDQARALVLRAERSPSPDLGAIVLFAMLTGARRGELCGLQWSDVDWSARRLTIRRSVWEVSSEWGIKDPKTHQVRRIALDPVALELLAARRSRADADAEAAGVALASDTYIWSTYVDGHAPRTPDSITRSFAHLCLRLEAEAKAAGRNESWRFRFHDLRHLSATEMIGAGMDPRTVASRLGHADPSVTLRVYAHALEERDREAAEGLGRSLASLPA